MSDDQESQNVSFFEIFTKLNIAAAQTSHCLGVLVLQETNQK
jgi:hypothetical protein